MPIYLAKKKNQGGEIREGKTEREWYWATLVPGGTETTRRRKLAGKGATEREENPSTRALGVLNQLARVLAHEAGKEKIE